MLQKAISRKSEGGADHTGREMGAVVRVRKRIWDPLLSICHPVL